MVKYYGRSRQQTGFSTNQIGLNMSGNVSRVGRVGSLGRNVSVRSKSNVKFCGGVYYRGQLWTTNKGPCIPKAPRTQSFNSGIGHRALPAFKCGYNCTSPIPVSPTPPTPAPVPKIGSRNQGAFILKNYQFSGASLWDGNSNADITGSSSIPGIFERGGNRGSSTNGYSAQLPFAGVGNANYTGPDTNNVNKAYNPTFNAKNDGNPIRIDGDNGTNENNDTIINNICKVKGDIWKKLLGPRPPGSLSDTMQNFLRDNWGSGFEIEAYVFPDTYNPNGSMWSDEKDDSSSLFKMNDVYSINIASDCKNYTEWKKKHSGKNAIQNAYKKIYTDAINENQPSTWLSTGNNKTIPLTLITGVMLPSVHLTGKSNIVAKEFNTYIKHGYAPLTKINFYNIGHYDVKAKKFIIYKPRKIDSTLCSIYNNSALAIRGTDGQTAASTKSITNYINKKDNFTLKNGVNPWNNFTSSLSPAFSASLLSKSAVYPILWYDSKYVDPFVTN